MASVVDVQPANELRLDADPMPAAGACADEAADGLAEDRGLPEGGPRKLQRRASSRGVSAAIAAERCIDVDMDDAGGDDDAENAGVSISFLACQAVLASEAA